ncbi:DoxX family protein [Marinomonas primoryensis]|jgi:putative oxidoreductase|uniref:DoxX family protein n=1 Tax=Marinomonas primoryensis TaxID=178399 RepID=UPI00275B4A19|nr:DoxX family protein [Marinomonas hwangdonensis]|tara:strand:- start:164 stop:634 length:471 start_codon:yes stop_codon:yes gene_type:complete
MLSFINNKSEAIFRKIPESVILLVARFAIAAVFWRSGQTKIEGFSLDLIAMKVELGLPRLAESTGFLFEYEYDLPLIPPMVAAILATLAEHILPILILSGLFTRLAGFGIAMMTLVIQLFVYPDAYPTHATWLAIALLLMYRGAGIFSLDHWLAKR